MENYKTVFGSIEDYRKGGVAIINDDAKNYVFSNVFEVAAISRPYERVAVGKNLEYVVEAVRAEGTSDWYTAAHDEFALAMDHEVEVHYVKLASPALVAPETKGAIKLQEEPEGQKMGRIRLKRGHQALLPPGAAYRFEAKKPATLLIQTIDGAETVHKWSEICQS